MGEFPGTYGVGAGLKGVRAGTAGYYQDTMQFAVHTHPSIFVSTRLGCGRTLRRLEVTAAAKSTAPVTAIPDRLSRMPYTRGDADLILNAGRIHRYDFRPVRVTDSALDTR